jgi:hypothetical protein
MCFPGHARRPVSGGRVPGPPWQSRRRSRCRSNVAGPRRTSSENSTAAAVRASMIERLDPRSGDAWPAERLTVPGKRSRWPVTTGRSPSASAVTSTRTYSRRKRRRGLGSTGSSLPSDAADPSVAPHRRHARETRGVTVGEQRRSHRAAELVGRDLLGAGYLLADAVEALVGPVRVPGFSRSVTRIRLVTTEASPRRRFHLIVYGRSGRNCWCTRWCAQIRR